MWRAVSCKTADIHIRQTNQTFQERFSSVWGHLAFVSSCCIYKLMSNWMGIAPRLEVWLAFTTAASCLRVAMHAMGLPSPATCTLVHPPGA